MGFEGWVCTNWVWFRSWSQYPFDQSDKSDSFDHFELSDHYDQFVPCIHTLYKYLEYPPCISWTFQWQNVYIFSYIKIKYLHPWRDVNDFGAIVYTPPLPCFILYKQYTIQDKKQGKVSILYMTWFTPMEGCKLKNRYTPPLSRIYIFIFK